MARIAGVDLPKEKRIEISLTYIYGIGNAMAGQILHKAGVDPNVRVKELGDKDVVKIRDAIKDLGIAVEGDLRKDVSMSIKRLVDIGAYRGTRHRKGLPARGQRTKTNARTKRGARRTVGVGKRAEAPARTG